MYNDAILPVTGTGGLAVAGHMLGLDWVVAAAISLILSGIILYRVTSRAKRSRAAA